MRYYHCLGSDAASAGRIVRGVVADSWLFLFGTANEMSDRAHSGDVSALKQVRGVIQTDVKVFTWATVNHHTERDFVAATEVEYLAQPHLTPDDLALTGLNKPRGLIE